MTLSTEPTTDQQVPDQTLLPLNLVNRLITLLYWVVIPSVFVMIAITAFYIVVSFLSQDAVEPSALPMQPLLSLANSIWSILSPIISIIIIAMLLRWLLFTPQSSSLTRKIQDSLTDVPSLIAIVVIATVCLLPFLRVTVPEVLSNIALVIIGFYFGTVRKVKTRTPEENEVVEQQELPDQS